MLFKGSTDQRINGYQLRPNGRSYDHISLIAVSYMIKTQSENDVCYIEREYEIAQMPFMKHCTMNLKMI